MITAEDFKTAMEEDSEVFSGLLKDNGFLSAGSVKELISTSEDGLKRKNRELLGKLKDLKAQSEDNSLKDSHHRLLEMLSDHQLGVEDIDKVDYDTIEEALDTFVSNSGKARDVDPKEMQELSRQLKKVERERERFSKEVRGKGDEVTSLITALGERDSYIEQIEIDGRFISALNSEGYSKPFVDVLVPKLRADSKASLEVEEDSGIRTVITDDGKAVKEWVKWWATTDEGKSFKMAPNNSGGGASGSGSGSGTPKTWKNMSISERNILMKSNPELARRLMAQRP